MNKLINHNLTGVVACGGKSTRMGMDKSLLNYHGKPQRYFIYDLLKTICTQVYISCNEEQSSAVDQDYNFITDDKQFSGHGPVSGLLTSFKSFPEKAILFVGCDYPHLNIEALQQLTENNDSSADAYCFIDTNNIRQPLIALYEYSSFDKLLIRFHKGKYSLRDFLETENIITFSPARDNLLLSADTWDEYKTEKINISSH